VNDCRRLLLPLLVAAALAGCRSYGPSGSLKWQVLLGQRDAGDDALDALSPNPEVRRWAVIRLGQAGDPAAAPILAARLSLSIEPNALLRATSAASLRSIGDPLAVPALAAACADPVAYVRAEAVRTLGFVAGSDQFPLLARTLEKDPAPAVRLEAAYALHRLGTSEATPYLVKALRDPDPSVAFAAHYALRSLTGLDAAPASPAWQQFAAADK